eukprot:XP_011601244.1 PREDICTED: uncharacterized protein LOC105416325 [Takifugu rubripes]
MDPADQDAVRRTLEAQGRLLGQHDQLLTDIWTSLQTLNASVTNLLASGRAELAPPPTPAEAPRVASQLVTAAPREPHVPVPERYSGEAGACASFLLQCSLVFDLQPLTYPSDRSSEASSQILSLRQGPSSVADYSIRFRILAARSGWNDAALQGVFTQGLSDDLKDEPSSSPVGAGFFFVQKKDGTLRPCIDYRSLNEITIKNKYPLPLLNAAFAPLHQAQVFSKLDLRSAYHLVRIREGDEWKTAFNTPLGHFEYLVMPFGLTNAPAVFQALINDVLRDMLNKFIFVYLDDILIFSESEEEHVQHVRLVLQRLMENRLFVKAEKCEFHTTSISFLGFVVARGQLSPDPAKVRAVMEWPTPSSRRQLQQFLGFANFYRRFIRDYSKVAAPLTRLTSTLLSFRWTPEAETAFNRLKGLFSSSPILTHPDPSRQFVVEVDASDVGVGAVLSQRSGEDQKLHPCAFFSHRLSPAERNYDVGNKELLAVVLALQEWRHWLEGATQPFIVWTDHKNLTYLRNAKRLSSRQARWALFVEERVREAQQSAPDPGGCPPNRLFVPVAVRSEVLHWAHSSRLTCHPGINRSLHFLRQRFWWPSMARDTKDYIAACPVYSRGKASHQPPAGLLQPLEIPRRPWSHIAVEFITGLPPSQGHEVVLTVVDRFSKSAHFIPLPKLPSAAETGELLVQHVFRLHGLPTDIVSDRGPQFCSQVWRSFCSALGASVSLTSGYHPQANGQAERTNQSLEDALRPIDTGRQPPPINQNTLTSMDPADQDAMRRMLEAPERLLGQHDQLLTDICASLQTLNISVTDLLTSERAEQGPSPPAGAGSHSSAGCCRTAGAPRTHPGKVFWREAQWAMAVLENQKPASSSFPAFTAELKLVFDHPVQSGEVASQILSLRQGSSSVVDYSIRFGILAARSSWNDVALRGVFTQGLADELKDNLNAWEESGDLETLISLPTQLDNRLRERHRQRGGCRWRTYAGGTNLTLPRGVEALAVSEGLFVLRPNELGSSTRMGVMHHQPGLGHASPYPRRDSAQPRPILGLNGEVLAIVTHQTQPFTLIVSGNHREQIRLFLIPASSPGVLGAPWLARHNPQIDWLTGRVVSWSVPCRTNCLRSALTPSPGGSDLARRLKEVGRSPRVVHLGGAVYVPGVGDGLGRVTKAVAFFLGAASWHMEERVGEAQQSVPDQGGVPSNQLFILADKVAVTSVQADVRQCRRVGRQARAALLQDSQYSQQQANQRWTPALSYQPCQKVWLSTKDLPLQVESQKLAPCFIGPFEVEQIVNPTAVHLKLSPAFKMHPTFHVSKVKPVAESALVSWCLWCLPCTFEVSTPSFWTRERAEPDSRVGSAGALCAHR